MSSDVLSAPNRSAARAGLLGWLLLAAVVFAADQATKWLILEAYRLGDATRVTDFFNIVRAHNSGAAFSFLAGAAGWQRWFFIVIALGASAFILHLLMRHGEQRMFSIALGLILGGAIGNVIDRLVHGQVVDFLLFYRGGWYFPAFNLADSAITVGAVLLILDELLRMKRVRVPT